MKRFRSAIAILILLALAGCSSTTFVYNRLPTLIPWLVDDYVELDQTQDSQLQRLLTDYFAQHRQDHLPRYVLILDQGLAALDGGLTDGELASLYQQAEAELRREQLQALDWLLAVGESLTAEQIAAFIANLRDKQTELEEEFLARDDREFRRDSAKNLRKQLQNYLGPLTGPQQQAVAALADDMVRLDHLWLADRARWVAELETLLARQPGWQDQVRQAVASRPERAAADYRAAFNTNLALTLTTLAQVIDGRTAKQDRHLRHKIAGLRGDLCLLIGETDGACQSSVIADAAPAPSP